MVMIGTHEPTNIKAMLTANEGPSDAILNVDESLTVETRDRGLEDEFVGVCLGALVLVSVFNGDRSD
jgi:hypothetical protein